jgi:hypothetical protein
MPCITCRCWNDVRERWTQSRAKPIRATRASWPPVYEQALAQLKQEDSPGIREFVRILRMQEEFSVAEVEAGLTAVLGHGQLSADAVRLHIRQLQKPEVIMPSINLSTLSQGDTPGVQAIGQQPVQLQLYNQLLMPHASGEPGGTYGHA